MTLVLVLSIFVLNYSWLLRHQTFTKTDEQFFGLQQIKNNQPKFQRIHPLHCIDIYSPPKPSYSMWSLL